MPPKPSWIALVLHVMPLRAFAGQAAPEPNSCVTCHSTLSDHRLATPATLFGGADVHREKGFVCIDCHGGNPTASDKLKAHDTGGRESAMAFRGKPTGQTIIATCARCHSDPELMRTFAPRQRVDQAAEYASSVHGTQLADYQKSVHHAARTKGNDLSAPTCNDCHGNHGAAPPGVGTMANVCGTCHVVFAQKFETSVHRQIFDKGCVECHTNHAVLKPSDEMLATTGHGICAPCHSADDKTDKGNAAAQSMRGSIERLKSSMAQSDVIVRRIKNAGIEVSDEQLALRET